MREALHALTDELRRLKATGVKTVPIADESLRALRAALESSSPVAAASSPAPIPVPTARPSAVSPRSSSEGLAPATAAAVVPPTSAPARAPKPVSGPVLPPAPPVFSLPPGTKAERWCALHRIVAEDPTCKAQLRPGKKVVLGLGDLEASVFFCGEAPGAEEELAGEPFVGPAGQKLNQILTAMGLAREKVYIGNIMNWRPRLEEETGPDQTGNRPPTDSELNYCLPYLKAQIELVKPKVIVALGATAAKGLLGPGSFRQLGEVRGRWLAYEGTPLRVTYHPSYLLRQDDMGKVAGMRARRSAWEDMLEVMERLEMPISEKQRGYFLKA